MGYRNPHGITGISSIILGFDEVWFEGEGFKTPQTFTPIEDIFDFQDWLSTKEEVFNDDGLDCKYLGNFDDMFVIDFDREAETKTHFYEMAIEAGLNPSHYRLLDKEYQAYIIKAWVKRTYGDYSDEAGLEMTEFSGRGGGARIGRPDLFYRLKKDCSDRYERARQPARKGKPGRRIRTSERRREWTDASWRYYFHHDDASLYDPSYGDGKMGSGCSTLAELQDPDAGETSLDPFAVREVLVEYPHWSVRKFASEMYYHHLLQTCNFSLADYKDVADGYFFDWDRFRPHEYDELDELEALYEQMLDYHELKTTPHRFPSWRRGFHWDFRDYDGSLGIFEDYQGPDNPSCLEDQLDNAAWIEIDRRAEEEALDREPSPAFSGSSRHDLRIQKPRLARERYFA